MPPTVPSESPRNAVLGVGIAAIAGNAFASGGYGFWDAIVGVLLLLVLVEFWSGKLSPLSLELAYVFALSYVLIMIFGLIGDLAFPFSPVKDGVPPSLWVLAFDDHLGGQFYRAFTIFMLWLSLGLLIRFWRYRFVR